MLVKSPSAKLADRLMAVSEEFLGSDPPQRLEDVAAAIGASRASLYYYFSGREDLVTFLVAQHAQEAGTALAAALDPDHGPRERLGSGVAAVLEFLASRPGLCSGLLGAMGASGRLPEALAITDQEVGGPLRELVGEASAGHQDPQDATNAVMGALLLAVLGRWAAGQDPQDVTFREALTAQVTRGVTG